MSWTLAMSAETTSPKMPRPISRVRYVLYVSFILLAAAIVYARFGYGLLVFRVPSHSMLNTLQVGDFIYTTTSEAYRRGDIVVLRDPDSAKKGGYLVKRLIGLPGDHVRIDWGALYLNGYYASEPYLVEPMRYDMAEYTLAGDEIFILGDNRNESEDSSVWVKDSTFHVRLEDIVGKVRGIYLPFSRIRMLRSFPLTNSMGE